MWCLCPCWFTAGVRKVRKSWILPVKPIVFHNSHEVNHPDIYLTLLIQSRCTEWLSNTDTAPLAQRSPGMSKAVANARLGRWRGDQQSSQQHLPVRERDSHSCSLWIYKPNQTSPLGAPPATLLTGPREQPPSARLTTGATQGVVPILQITAVPDVLLALVRLVSWTWRQVAPTG